MNLVLVKKLLNQNNLVRTRFNILNFYKNNNSLKEKENFLIIPISSLSSILINVLRLSLNQFGISSYQLRTNYSLENFFSKKLKKYYIGQVLLIPFNFLDLILILNILNNITLTKKTFFIFKTENNLVIKSITQIENALNALTKISFSLNNLIEKIYFPVILLNSSLKLPILQLFNILKYHLKKKMPSYKQLIKGIRKTKTFRTKVPAFYGSPQKRGVCVRVGIVKPKKPNSAQRKIAKIRLSNKRFIIAYIPGLGHNLQQHSTVLVRGGRVPDLPGVRYHIMRGKLDFNLKETFGRKNRRSKYATKLRNIT